MRLGLCLSLIFIGHLGFAASDTIYGKWTLSSMYCENGTPLDPEVKALSQNLIQGQMSREFSENGITEQNLNIENKKGVKCSASATASYEINSVIGFSNLSLKIRNCIDENLESSMDWFEYILQSQGYFHRLNTDGTLFLYSLVDVDKKTFCAQNERLIEVYNKQSQ